MSGSVPTAKTDKVLLRAGSALACVCVRVCVFGAQQ